MDYLGPMVLTLNDMKSIGKLTLCPRPIKKKMMLDLATALSFLHSRGIVHLDIKPANIMAGVILSEKGNAATTYLIDYGMSCLLGDTCENISNPVGTILYMSPEMAKKVNNTNLTQIDAKSDVFSIGLVYLYILTNGYVVFENALSTALGNTQMLKTRADDEVTLNAITKGINMLMYTKFNDFADIIKQMLQIDKNDRPTIDQVKSSISSIKNVISSS